MILTQKQAMQIARQGGTAPRITEILREMDFNAIRSTNERYPDAVDVEVINTNGTVTRIRSKKPYVAFTVNIFKQGDFSNRSAAAILKQMIELF